MAKPGVFCQINGYVVLGAKIIVYHTVDSTRVLVKGWCHTGSAGMSEGRELLGFF